MSPNSENAMARFLFAILKQKSLKDIDWDLVASDSALIEPITNGHAARMRFSRFRQTISGAETTKRSNRVDKNCRITKPTKTKRSSSIKSESTPGISAYPQYSPASTTSPYMGDTSDDFSSRFLTPCSDDVAHLAINPRALEVGSHMLAHQGFSSPMDFMPPSHAMVSPAFSAFDDASLDMNGNLVLDTHSQSGFDATNFPLF